MGANEAARVDHVLRERGGDEDRQDPRNGVAEGAGAEAARDEETVRRVIEDLPGRARGGAAAGDEPVEEIGDDRGGEDDGREGRVAGVRACHEPCERQDEKKTDRRQGVGHRSLDRAGSVSRVSDSGAYRAIQTSMLAMLRVRRMRHRDPHRAWR